MAVALMAGVLTGISATSPLTYAESDCESSVESFVQCVETFGTAFMEDDAADEETRAGNFQAPDAVIDEVENAEDERAFLAAAPTQRYQVFVTLTDVPAGAEDLIVNATILRLPGFIPVSNTDIKTVTSPFEGEVVKLNKLRVPAGSNENAFLVCGTQAISGINRCDIHSLPLPSNPPIRVNYAYPIS